MSDFYNPDGRYNAIAMRRDARKAAEEGKRSVIHPHAHDGPCDVDDGEHEVYSPEADDE